MKNIKWLVLGYFMAMYIHGCDTLVGVESDSIGTESYERGCCEWNPIYVRVVD
tara:strand:+ start:12784 stop:12942 length:159 start_codon:yes stop_codon:yes gene_type:complete